VHASLVARILFSSASVHVRLAHPAQLKTLPALSSFSPRARVLSTSHGVSPSQGGFDTRNKHQCIGQRSENKGITMNEGLSSKFTLISVEIEMSVLLGVAIECFKLQIERGYGFPMLRRRRLTSNCEAIELEKGSSVRSYRRQ
jgi:hypothetical protein